MIRSATLIPFCLFIVALGVFAEPDRPAADLSGTTWEGTTSEGDHHVFEFREEGRLLWTDASGRSRDGTWKQDGALVTFTLPDGHTHYTVEIEGSRMRGRGRNQAGWTWTLTAFRRGSDEANVLVGSIWSSTDSDGDVYTFRFLANGILHWKSPSGSYTNGTWSLEDDTVVMKLNDGYSVYTGILAGERMDGRAVNRVGVRWTWSATFAGRSSDGPAPTNIEGTVWAGEDDTGEPYVFRFRKGGILSYTSNSGSYTNGTWKQEGASVYMEMNDRYAEYRGTISDRRIGGTAKNVKDRRWTWWAVLQQGVDAGAPPPTEEEPGTPSDLTGQVWSGTDSNDRDISFEFREGGKLAYTIPDGTFENGTWKQDGDSVTMEMNDHYAEYTGTIRDGRIEGTAKNTLGKEWFWSVRRAPRAVVMGGSGPLEGTTWAGEDSDGDHYVFTFLEGGVLEWTSPAGTYRDGTWERDGGGVTFNLNNGFSTYTGRIEGGRMSGTARNKEGRTWRWSVTRKADK